MTSADTQQTDTPSVDILLTHTLKDTRSIGIQLTDIRFEAVVEATHRDHGTPAGPAAILIGSIRTAILALVIGDGTRPVGTLLASTGTQHRWAGTVTLISMTDIRRPDRHTLVST